MGQAASEIAGNCQKKGCQAPIQWVIDRHGGDYSHHHYDGGYKIPSSSSYVPQGRHRPQAPPPDAAVVNLAIALGECSSSSAQQAGWELLQSAKENPEECCCVLSEVEFHYEPMPLGILTAEAGQLTTSLDVSTVVRPLQAELLRGEDGFVQLRGSGKSRLVLNQLFRQQQLSNQVEQHSLEDCLEDWISDENSTFSALPPPLPLFLEEGHFTLPPRPAQPSADDESIPEGTNLDSARGVSSKSEASTEDQREADAVVQLSATTFMVRVHNKFAEKSDDACPPPVQLDFQDQRVSQIAECSPELAELGVQPGDFLLSINGVSEDSAAMFDLLDSADTLQLVISRPPPRWIVLDKKQHGPVGLDVSFLPFSLSILLVGIHDTGAALAWNHLHPEEAIQEYDRIVGTDSLHGDGPFPARAILQSIGKAKEVVKVRVVRPGSVSLVDTFVAKSLCTFR
eukprot:CAMPEP_0206559530 /NCGR_PEP_ID=MMETSP0325_2-20121206/20451_1 /ASSEMBLY_ACC=CAM_ASM_000347 /TAXON_ID=2866 /ORGANISM="Crypthecodinium cohnii, Strain Seligo" /LENGTH=454 /DNA_ID=CAMNT_0054061053 /DNA_START=94 /DNA_END=1458 /DNA_ORIENTATION=-